MPRDCRVALPHVPCVCLQFVNVVFPSGVLKIDYNQKLFIFMQPIDDRMEFWETIIIGKNPQAKKSFLFNTKCKLLFNFSYKMS